jgi:hypothetical protein
LKALKVNNTGLPVGDVTVRDSQDEMLALLLASPLYAAWKLKLPVELKITTRLFGITPLLTVTIETVFPGEAQAPFAKSV